MISSTRLKNKILLLVQGYTYLCKKQEKYYR